MTIENFTAAELGAAKRMLRHLLKTDLCAFVEKAFGTVCPGEQFWPSWPFEAIAHALESVVEGKTKRLIILMPPRNLKSIFARHIFLFEFAIHPLCIVVLDRSGRRLGCSSKPV